MGTEVAVASSVFNMAGPESKRPDYLKSLIIGAIFQNAPSLADVIGGGYLDGPGLRFRNFAKWAKRDKDFQKFMGITSGELRVPVEIDMGVLKAALPQRPGHTLRIESAAVDAASYLRWAQQWVALHHPERLNEAWVCEYERTTNTISITFPDDTVESFLALNYEAGARYLYVSYTPIADETVDPIQWGPAVPVPEGQTFPSVSGWLQDFANFINKSVEVRTTKVIRTSFSDNRPNIINTIVSNPETKHYIEIDAQYQKTDYRGNESDRDAVSSVRSVRQHKQTGRVVEQTDLDIQHEVIEDGVVKIIQTVTITESLILDRTVRVGTERTTHKAWLPLEILIYKEGDGNPALDAFFGTSKASGNFYPPIPFRYANEPISKDPWKWRVVLPQTVDPMDWWKPLKFAPSISRTGEDDVREGRIVESFLDGSVLVRSHEGSRLQDVLGAKTIPVVLQAPPRPEDAYPWDPDPEPEWAPLASILPVQPNTKEAYASCKKAFKRAFNGDFGKVLKQINENDSIDDIDYAYAVFGVSLNVEENACRKYIYKFLQYLMRDTSMPVEARAQWQAEYEAALDSWQQWLAWKERQKEWGGGVRISDPEPQVTEYPDWRYTASLDVYSRHKDQETTNYRNNFRWDFISEERGQGLLKPGAKRGELWFEILDPLSQDFETYQGQNLFYQRGNNVFTLSWQETKNSWRRLTVHGLEHRNYIYENERVLTLAVEALQDGEESGFIIPLHEDVYHSISLKDRTQMATACCFLVFNCSAIRKTSFWEDFGVILVIILIIAVSVVVTIITGGTGTVGLLGSAEAVGTFFGATGTAALIIGAAVNALAGIIVSYLITEGSVAIFGEKWGKAVGIISSALLTLGAGAAMNSADLVDALLSTEALIQLSQAGTEGFNAYIQAATQEINQATQELMEKRSEELKELQKLYDEEFSPGRKIDPKLVSEYISELTEKAEQFLTRTLMTGSDIVDLQLAYLENFAKFTVHTDLS